ncbi:MAG TPA: serine/threonine-protein kinase [Actinoplanes sp.]|nr:serine/threonine-protein kinase [Actinoplanes sp.]
MSIPAESYEQPVAQVVDVVVGGRYRLLQRIGSGGMGVVWLARDEVLRRRVAVKELHHAWGSSDRTVAHGRERSMREARAAAALHHPNIVSVYDIVDHDGRPWIVMELVSGRSLKEIVAEDGPLPVERAVTIALELLAALQAAHRAGITHRDVKPANVLVGDSGSVRLADFGLATHPDAEPLTDTGAVLGTPGYLAPEQASGQTPGPPADMFGLAATLYYAIEGVGPFHRDGYLPMLSAYARHDIRPPKRAGAMAPVLVQMLAADPARRPTAEQAREMLLGGAARQSWRGLRLAVTDDRWRQAAHTFQTFGTMFLLALGLHRVVFPHVVAKVTGGSYETGGFEIIDLIDIVRAVGWAMVLVAALIPRRRTAAGLALATAVVEMTVVASWYEESPSHFLYSAWWATTALVVAATSIWHAAGQQARRPRALGWFGGALACAAGASLCDFLQDPWSVSPAPGLGWSIADLNGGSAFRLAAPLYLTAAALAGWAWWRQDGLTRRRFLALTAPVGAVAAIVTYGFAGFLTSSQQFASPIRLAPVQWAILGATPAIAFALAVFLLERWERPKP